MKWKSPTCRDTGATSNRRCTPDTRCMDASDARGHFAPPTRISMLRAVTVDLPAERGHGRFWRTQMWRHPPSNHQPPPTMGDSDRTIAAIRKLLDEADCPRTPCCASLEDKSGCCANLAQNARQHIPVFWTCLLCGRSKFTRPGQPHRCQSGARKRFKAEAKRRGLKNAFVPFLHNA